MSHCESEEWITLPFLEIIIRFDGRKKKKNIANELAKARQ